MARDATLPAVVLGAGLLLALLALGLAARSKSLLKDVVDLDCSERALHVVVAVRDAQEARLAALTRGEPPGQEIRAVYRVAPDGAVLERTPPGAPDPRPALLPAPPSPAAATAPPAGASAASGPAWQPVVLRGPGALSAAHWRAGAAGEAGLLVEWDLQRVRERLVQPALETGDARYALFLLRDTENAWSAGVPFTPKAVMALDPPLSFWRVAVGLADPDATRRSLRLQTALLGALALCLLLVLAGGVLLSLRRERGEQRRRREREELLARAAHELQTPLALLRAAAESVERGAVSDPQEVQRCLEIVAREEGRLTERVRRLLRHLRREVEAPSGGDVREEVEAAARELEPSLRACGVALSVEDQLGPGWEAPRELVGDAVRELLGNVARHARGARAVRLALGPAAAGRVTLVVEDDGPGLGPLPASGQRGGLGLLLVRQGLELAGGSLRLGPGPRGGAEARLEVPCRRA